MGRIIYHYCSVESFYKIINSKELWLFNALDMNDKLETTWIYSIMEKNFNRGNMNNFWERLQHLVENRHTENWFTPYLMCFSKDGDSLSQWRAYASDGAGVAIGINEDAIDIENKLPLPVSDNRRSLGIYDCLYDVQEQIEIIDKLFSGFSEVPLVNVHSNKFLKQTISFAQYSLVFKNPKFREEQETRIIYIPQYQIYKPYLLASTGNILTMNFTSKNESILPYFKLPLKDNFSSKLIPVISFGPKCKIRLDNIRMFLSANQLEDTKIIPSAASYR
jgi:hypothetical protein